ncbi:insulin-like growth factor 1 receptor isoform X2 [Palaemon carinicauda]
MEYFYVRWRWILLFALLVPEIDGIQANPDVTESAAVMIPNKASNNCGSKRIFESIASIKQLQGCQVIEGDLQMLLIESKDNLTSEWKKYTFPDLVEITGYLLVFRVQGLHSLGQLFPNLTVIRGLTTHMNYALIIWRAEDMETVGLPKLTSILRGGVWIDNNAKLCTVDTDWSAITAGQDVENILRTKSNCVPCNSSETCRLENCASGTRCQEKCNPECGNRGCTNNNECCPEECLGGCQTVNGSTYCTACRHLREGRHVKEGSFCTEKCSRHFYKYLGYKCVTDLECTKKGGYFHKASSGELECVRQCPLGYKEETNLGLDGQEVPQCKKCDGGVCDKTCPGRFVRNARNAQALKGCTVINGSLEISIPGRKDISKTLMESLRNLKEVTGYVRIFRSKSLTSLDFLSSLVAIGRDKLYGDK